MVYFSIYTKHIVIAVITINVIKTLLKYSSKIFFLSVFQFFFSLYFSFTDVILTMIPKTGGFALCFIKIH